MCYKGAPKVSWDAAQPRGWSIEGPLQVDVYAEAKEQFSIIKSEGWASVKAYSLMAQLWAEQGQVEEIQTLMEEAKKEGCFSQEAFLPVLVQVQLKRLACRKVHMDFIATVAYSVMCMALAGRKVSLQNEYRRRQQQQA